MIAIFLLAVSSDLQMVEGVLGAIDRAAGTATVYPGGSNRFPEIIFQIVI